ncbi:MAG TPA: BlaI/MecI/CopY family transcriptional regulator [Pirellulales bacterium]|jgi:predicted transcriptional regulator|nr:BlaI/MecI/CopY family transcriptional regulator [Pirellulales bacterium]
MARPNKPHPTDLELAILKVLWQKAPQTVEAVREALAAGGRGLTHSSVITMMNIMVRKKYLQRKKRGRAFEYDPLVDGQDVNRRLLGDMVNRVFDGSAAAVLLELLETSDVSQDELAEIRRLINRKAQERGS